MSAASAASKGFGADKTLLPAGFTSAGRFYLRGPHGIGDAVGSRWNDAKTAEEAARVKHSV